MTKEEKKLHVIQMKFKLRKIREITNKFEMAIIDEDEIGMANSLVYLVDEIKRAMEKQITLEEYEKSRWKNES